MFLARLSHFASHARRICTKCVRVLSPILPGDKIFKIHMRYRMPPSPVARRFACHGAWSRLALGMPSPYRVIDLPS